MFISLVAIKRLRSSRSCYIWENVNICKTSFAHFTFVYYLHGFFLLKNTLNINGGSRFEKFQNFKKKKFTTEIL